MASLGSMVRKIRSKNAGPFWLTLDIFCEDKTNFIRICEGLQNTRIADLFNIEESMIRRFEISQLNVIRLVFLVQRYRAPRRTQTCMVHLLRSCLKGWRCQQQRTEDQNHHPKERWFWPNFFGCGGGATAVTCT